MALRFKTNKRLVLASASPRRKEILSLIAESFEIIPSNADEAITQTDPEAIVMELSFKKAQSVAAENPQAIVVGADTLVFGENSKPLGKPETPENAFEMLKNLSGKKHRVVTGVSIVCLSEQKRTSFSESTDVYFRHFTDDEIYEYIDLEKPFDMAGAYAIQGFGSLLVQRIDGDFQNVVGLPAARLASELQKFS